MNTDDIIFLSASVPYRKEWVLDSKPIEIEEAIVSIARAVFTRGGRLLFGGHPSVSPLVSAVAGEYFPADPSRGKRPVVTFQSRLYEGDLPDETTDMVKMGWSTIEWTPRVKGKNPDQTKERSLAVMRDQMLLGSAAAKGAVERNDLRPPVAMIVVGGMEGIRDEAALFLQKREAWAPRRRRRVYVFKSGGGAAARLVGSDMRALWPTGAVDSAAMSTLLSAREKGDLVDVELKWQDLLEEPERSDEIQFQPYAAMVQWLLDTQLGPVS